jgi:hypothetical protein
VNWRNVEEKRTAEKRTAQKRTAEKTFEQSAARAVSPSVSDVNPAKQKHLALASSNLGIPPKSYVAGAAVAQFFDCGVLSARISVPPCRRS